MIFLADGIFLCVSVMISVVTIHICNHQWPRFDQTVSQKIQVHAWHDTYIRMILKSESELSFLQTMN